MEVDKGIIKSKCPKCGGEMKEGYIYSCKGVISWTPKNEKPPSLVWETSDHGIQLGEYSFWKNGKATAMNCESCKMVIIEYGEK